MAGWFSPHDMVDYQVAEYLSGVGVCRHPDQDMSAAGDSPPVFLGAIPQDAQNTCVAVIVAVDDRADDDACPVITVLVVMRGEPDDLAGLRRLTGAVFTALHDRIHFELTATQRCLLSRRISKGREVQDQNRRWQRADLFRLRLAVPTLTEGAEHGA